MNSLRVKGHHRLRLGRCSRPDQAYHVTFGTRRRRPVFRRFDAARLMIRTMRFADRSLWCHTYGFVVMPDHVHWLFELGGAKPLSRLIQSVKRFSASQLVRRRMADGPVWEPGYFDHAIRADEDLRTVSRYIVANPLRAGLCVDIGEYPHWDAVWIDAHIPDR
jgi:REP element-mobilizing transposase RayT